MKILITSDWYKPVINGVVTSVINLADGLTAMGHDVRILTLSGSRRSFQQGNVIYIGSVSAGMVYPNARLRTGRAKALVRSLIEWKPDIVHSQCEFSTFHLARKIAKKCGCPLVHTYHTVYEDFTHYFSPSVRLGRVMAAKFSHYTLEKTDAVIVPSDKIRAMLLRYGVTEPIATVPTGLELGSFLAPMKDDERAALREKLGLSEKDLALTFIGRLAKEKNVGELISYLPDTAENVKLLLVGDGPYREELEAEIIEKGVQDKVIRTGMVRPDQVATYYKAGDVFVNASQSETQGLTYMEAMASGLPLLCKEDDCLQDVLNPGENGFVFRGGEDFLVAVDTLQNRDLRAKLGAAAQQDACDKFSKEGFAGAALRVYQQCLSRAAETSAA